MVTQKILHHTLKTFQSLIFERNLSISTVKEIKR